jgi:hypothetical protein
MARAPAPGPLIDKLTCVTGISPLLSVIVLHGRLALKVTSSLLTVVTAAIVSRKLPLPESRQLLTIRVAATPSVGSDAPDAANASARPSISRRRAGQIAQVFFLLTLDPSTSRIYRRKSDRRRIIVACRSGSGPVSCARRDPFAGKTASANSGK